MQKTLLCFCALFLVSFCLTACGSSEPKPEEQKEQAKKLKNLDERN